MSTTDRRADPARSGLFASRGAFSLIVVGCAVAIVLPGRWLLTNIFERKQEAQNPYVRLVEVNENTTDPAPWGMNWPREYDDYKRTVDATRTTLRRIREPAGAEGRARSRG